MNKFYTIVITTVLIACQHINHSATASKNDNEEHERSKRFIFLRTSGIGVSVDSNSASVHLFSVHWVQLIIFTLQLF